VKINLSTILLIITLILIAALFSCGGHSRKAAVSLGNPAAPAAEAPAAAKVTWPTLPVDKAQPWETLDGAGRVVSSINLQSEFIPGVERFLEGGVDVTDNGEATTLDSGDAGDHTVSWAIYRIPMGADQPGTIAADANLWPNSSYYVGVGDYSANTWHWYGPFSVSHVRFNVPPASYTSGLGNLMLAVVAYDGSYVDLVGLGVNARDSADTTPPPVPARPWVSPYNRTALVEWPGVIAPDLAGYHVYVNGEDALGYIEGGTDVAVPTDGISDISVSSVDLSGNESAPSEAETSNPPDAAPLTARLTASLASGMRGDIIYLTASGGDTYDWDTDGDGTWDMVGTAANTAFANTSNMGIIRPRIYAHTTAGDGFWMGAVSLIIAGNSRPVVSATAAPQSGAAPLDVNFTITGEDIDGTIAECAWDFDGDGVFDGAQATDPSPLNFVYNSNGLFNAKFRVTDNEGGWDVDTVAIQVASNLPPVALLTLNTDKAYMGELDPSDDIVFDARASYDPEDGQLEYAWDTEGTGIFSAYASGAKMLVKSYTSPGIYQATVRVRDAQGMVAESSRQVSVYRYKHYTIDDAFIDSYFFSLIAAGGFPAVCFYDWTNGDLRYYRAISAFPLSPTEWTGYAIETVGDTGHYPRPVVLNNGCPAIAYQDITNGDLKFAVADNPTPSDASEWSTHIIDATPASPYWSSLGCVMNNGYPIISYYDDANDDLKFARATVEAPSAPADWSIHTVDSGGSVGRYSSISVIYDGASYLPAIAYWDASNINLKYARATAESPSGAGDWIVYTLDPGGGNDVGEYTIGMLSNPGVNNGNPVVAYVDMTNHDFKLAIADVLLPDQESAWNVILMEHSSTMSNCGLSASVLRLGGRLLVSYTSNRVGTKLVKAKISNPISAGDWWYHTIDTGTWADWWGTSLVEFNGKPMMAYSQSNSTNSVVGFAIPTLE
jgi:hypothetical protein